ncbi:molybdopterin guanine dinucleotide biosynthesis accessory protein MobB [Pasteurella langaaensis DSM 22999]|uniref:Molybdopterin guanine dinucleotide biosynthesis accessory protein MobB n=1 Tax=Alitibacter langaaensis DSM 22999 TaxID=1122935 RepID=A0A2U0T6R1_9PAST|nr:molybdopterin-guanine dinucleotide biosynthesis protein B [Pasteurella langaaensis]PVX39285.1 molybdopterin guanine dinucleotide biosynthesis accessory protein MobB [Pasteurella langaaensis DSM 22999]
MIPLLGITGYSGSGKTTLLEKIVPKLTALGLRVAVIKHSHHNASVDKEGKDSWRMKEAGASQVIMACDNCWALMTETPKQPVSLPYLAAQFDPALTDLILVEGFKQEPIPKILLHRQEMTKPFPELDENVLAVATDYPVQTGKVRLNINEISEIVAFIHRYYRQQQ